MDLTKITDLDKLKALAYDELQKFEIAKQNLQLIQQRITEVQNEPKQKNKSDKK